MSSPQETELRILRNVELGKAVVLTFEYYKLWILRQVQRGDLVVTANQLVKLWKVTNIQLLDTCFGTIVGLQSLQMVDRYVTKLLVIPNIKTLQQRVMREVQRREFIRKSI